MYFEKLPSGDLYQLALSAAVCEDVRKRIRASCTLQWCAFEFYPCDSLVVRYAAVWDPGMHNAVPPTLVFFSITIY